MLDKEKIVANAKKYYETLKKHGIDNDQFIQFLGTEFVSQSASTQLDYHFCYEGGLINYLLTVTKYAIGINDSLPENEQVNKESLIKVCLLHGIGKAHLYIPNESEWHREKQGKLYEFNEKVTSMRVGERSIYYLAKFNIKLNEDEHIAILNADKITDRMSDYHNSMVGELLKMGSILAIKHDKLKK